MDIEIDIPSHIIKNRQYTTIIQLRKANRSKTKGSCASNDHKGLIYPSTKSPPDCVPGGAPTIGEKNTGNMPTFNHKTGLNYCLCSTSTERDSTPLRAAS
jgi:hypothetical protein